MEEFLIQLGTMSLQASVVVAAVLVLRFLFQKLHIAKKYTMLLWLVPYICMVCPWKFGAPFSFWGKGETLFSKLSRVALSIEHKLFIDPNSQPLLGFAGGASDNTANLVNGQMIVEGTLNGQMQGGTSIVGNATNAISGMTASDFLYAGLFTAWLVGFLMVGGYCLFSYWKLKKRLLCSVSATENIYYADDIDTAFVVGFVKPKIYLPTDMKKEYASYVIAHEQTHIRRFDPWKKLLALAITCVHWFNPVAWLAFVLLGKDMEMTCDEETVARLGMETKKDYAGALLQLSAAKGAMLGAPLAFGEGDTKARIKNIVQYKKTVWALTALALVVTAVIAVGFLGKESDYVTLGSDEAEWMMFPATEDCEITVLYNEGDTTKFVVFPDAGGTYAETFVEFLKNVEVDANPLSMSRAEDRAKDIGIRIHESVYFYFDEDMSQVWCDNGIKPSYTFEVRNPKGLREFVEAQLDSITEVVEATPTEVPSTEAMHQSAMMEKNEGIENGYPPIPYFTPGDEVVIDATGTNMDYADGNIVIFHDYYGLFVYDINEQKIAGAISLEPIGCNYTQGDNYCEVMVNSQGTTIYLHPLQEKEMYVYDIATGVLTQQKYNMEGIEIFDGFDKKEDIVDWDPTVFQTRNIVQVSKENWIHMESGSGLIQDLAVVITKDGKQESYLKVFENYYRHLILIP